MTEYNAPNPCLQAILLTTSTHSGPQFVCHYPPVPGTYNSGANRMREVSELQSDSSDAMDSSDSLSEDDDDDSNCKDSNDDPSRSDMSDNTKRPGTIAQSLLDRLENQRSGRRTDSTATSASRDIGEVPPSLSKKLSDETIGGRDSARGSVGGGLGTAAGSSAASVSKGLESWQKVLGFDADFLGELLSPTRGMCNTKFELTVDDTVFLGIPVHIRQNGEWKGHHNHKYAPRSHGSTLMSKKSRGSTARRGSRYPKSNRNNSVGSEKSNGSSVNNPEDEDEIKANEGDDEIDSDDNDKTNFNSDNKNPHLFDDDEEEDEDYDEDSENEGRNDYADPRSPMRMFHVVFVMNPPVTEYNLRVDEMYHYVLTNFVKCLKHEQAKNNYVWKEVSTMLHLRENASLEGLSAYQMWNEMERESSLAASIGQLFHAISNSEIANILINSKLRSFQIPVQTEFQTLPPITTTRLNTAYLTTTGPFVDTVEDSAEGLTAHYGILLLEEPESIIRDISADPYSTLAAFIREVNPTQSIQMMATESGLSVEQIVEITRNLMYWRRARVIIPIHHRNIYIVSPLAPMADLYKLTPLFEEKFPSLPSLPRMLAMLSTGRPRNFSSHIPSRDHRRVYLMALAWLLRFGFVTQLKTFLWIKISKRIKTSVYHDIQLEEEMVHLKTPGKSKRTDTSTDNTSKQRQSPTKTPGVGVIFEEPIESSVGHGHRSSISSLSKSNDDNKLKQDGDDPEDEEPASSESGGSEELDIEDDTILLEPDRASALQKKWINKMLEDKPNDVQAVFFKVMRYFNGKNTMEKAMVLETLSRQDMRRLTTALEDHLVVVRHW